MADTKNLCAQIPLTLHDRVCTEKDQAGLTTAQYITNLLIEYYQMKENGGNMNMANNGSRTMAFQIPEELFQRIKAHLDRESLRLGRKYTQREFVLGLIEEALTDAEDTCQAQENTEDTQQPQEDGEETYQPQEDGEETCLLYTSLPLQRSNIFWVFHCHPPQERIVHFGPIRPPIPLR